MSGCWHLFPVGPTTFGPSHIPSLSGSYQFRQLHMWQGRSESWSTARKSIAALESPLLESAIGVLPDIIHLLIKSAYRTRFQLRRPSDCEGGVCCKSELGSDVPARLALPTAISAKVGRALQ
jgi:hypothetical protein